MSLRGTIFLVDERLRRQTFVKPAAKEGDRVVGVDVHFVLVPTPAGPIPTPTPMPFSGVLVSELSPHVVIERAAAATVGSKAMNVPPHLPAGGPFQRPPANEGTVAAGSSRVFIERRAAARAGDPATTCNDPADAPNGVVVAMGRVFVGG
jgi:uncharacterized Zn-binding protein involved in type VI secretion